MGGNFPAGKREGRDRREGNQNFGTQGRPGGRTKGLREPAGTPRSRQDTKYRNITKNRSLLKYLLIITSSILARFGRF